VPSGMDLAEVWPERWRIFRRLDEQVGAMRLPETVVMALMESDGWDRAKSRATLSSIPGSQSMRTDFMLQFSLWVFPGSEL